MMTKMTLNGNEKETVRRGNKHHERRQKDP